MEKFKKETDVIGISKPGSSGGIGFDPTEEISAERRKRIQYLTKLENIVLILFIVVMFFFNDFQSNLSILPYFLFELP